MKEIMEEYSTTFFDCVLEYPEDVQQDIFNLYAYLRVVDEMVEQTDADGKIYNYKEWRQIISSDRRSYIVCNLCGLLF